MKTLTRVAVVMGLLAAALFTTAAAAVPPLADGESVVTDVVLPVGELADLQDVAEAGNFHLLVAQDLSIYGVESSAMRNVRSALDVSVLYPDTVLSLDLATYRVWGANGDEPYYCATDESPAECVQAAAAGAEKANTTHPSLYSSIVGLIQLIFGSPTVALLVFMVVVVFIGSLFFNKS